MSFSWDWQIAAAFRSIWPHFGIAPLVTAGAGGLVTQAEVAALIGGLESALMAVETALISEVFGKNLPLLGSRLSQAANQALPALHQVTGLKDAIKNGLTTLTGAATYTKAQASRPSPVRSVRRKSRSVP